MAGMEWAGVGQILSSPVDCAGSLDFVLRVAGSHWSIWPRSGLCLERFLSQLCGVLIVQEVAEDAGRVVGRRLESDSQRLARGHRGWTGAGQCRAGGQPWAVLCRQDLWMKGKWSVKKRGDSNMTPASPPSHQVSGGDRHWHAREKRKEVPGLSPGTQWQLDVGTRWRK